MMCQSLGASQTTGASAVSSLPGWPAPEPVVRCIWRHGLWAVAGNTVVTGSGKEPIPKAQGMRLPSGSSACLLASLPRDRGDTARVSRVTVQNSLGHVPNPAQPVGALWSPVGVTGWPPTPACPRHNSPAVSCLISEAPPL